MHSCEHQAGGLAELWQGPKHRVCLRLILGWGEARLLTRYRYGTLPCQVAQVFEAGGCPAKTIRGIVRVQNCRLQTMYESKKAFRCVVW